jgi:hypothetical protein
VAGADADSGRGISAPASTCSTRLKASDAVVDKRSARARSHLRLCRRGRLLRAGRPLAPSTIYSAVVIMDAISRWWPTTRSTPRSGGRHDGRRARGGDDPGPLGQRLARVACPEGGNRAPRAERGGGGATIADRSRSADVSLCPTAHPGGGR